MGLVIIYLIKILEVDCLLVLNCIQIPKCKLLLELLGYALDLGVWDSTLNAKGGGIEILRKLILA